jgi:hypothetical protein
LAIDDHPWLGPHRGFLDGKYSSQEKEAKVNPIEFLKKANTVLVFILLVAAIVCGGYVVARLRHSKNTIPVSIDSVHIHKK